MSGFLLNSFFFRTAVAPSGITRVFYESAYTASRSTTTATTAINVNTITGVNSGSNGLVVLYQGTTDVNTTAADVRLNLVSGSLTASTVIGLNMEPQDTTDRFSMGSGYFLTSSTNNVFSSSFSQETAGNTAGYAGYSLVALQLTASDSGSHSAGATSYRNATYTTKTSVPVPAGTYIVIGSAAVNPQDSGVVGGVRMFDGTTAYGEMVDVYEQDTTNWSPYWHVFRRTTTGTTTFSLQGRGDGGNDIEVRQASVITLNTAQFSNVYYAERTGSFSTTSTTYVNAMSGSFTIANPSNKHLLLASAMLSGSSTVDSFACKLQNTTTATDYIPEHLREPNSTAERYSTVVCRIVTFSGASNTIAWQLDCETGGTTAHLQDMTIAILDLGTT
jgi:hypothetical protein